MPLLAAFGWMLATAADAQQYSVTIQSPPSAPGEARRLSLDLALEAAEAAVSTCAREGYGVAVAVTDVSGDTRVLVLGDTTNSRLGEFARRKARTAALFDSPTAMVAQNSKSDGAIAARLAADTSLLTWAGGLPIETDGIELGAIGVGGAPGGDKDEACAKAGLAKIADRLK